MSAIWKNQSLGLSGVETAILVKMADHAADNGTQIFPSFQTISKSTKFSVRAIKYTVADLVKRKIIILVKRGNSKTHKSNLYRLNLKMIIQEEKPVENKQKTPHKKSNSVPPPSARRAPALVHHVHPNHHQDPSSLNDHIRGASQGVDKHDDFLKNDLFMKLKQMNVADKSINGWIREFGVERIFYQIALMKEQERLSNKKIHSPGAYLRRMLEAYRGKQ
jgi:hypothetical protein